MACFKCYLDPLSPHKNKTNLLSPHKNKTKQKNVIGKGQRLAKLSPSAHGSNMKKGIKTLHKETNKSIAFWWCIDSTSMHMQIISQGTNKETIKEL